jgi:uncharacterized protein with HEPN domain
MVDKDAGYLLDMLQASREAANFAADLHNEDAFRGSRLHQHAIM